MGVKPTVGVSFDLVAIEATSCVIDDGLDHVSPVEDGLLFGHTLGAGQVSIEAFGVGIGPRSYRLCCRCGGELLGAESVGGESLGPLLAQHIRIDAGVLGGSRGESCLLSGVGGIGAELGGEVQDLFSTGRHGSDCLVGHTDDVGDASVGVGPRNPESVAVMLHLGLGEIARCCGVGEEFFALQRSNGARRVSCPCSR